MSHIEMRASVAAAAAADQKSASESVDDSYLRKKFKKRDRSPSSLLNESPPPPSSSSADAAAASTCLTPSTQLKKEKQRPETWNKNEQQIFFNALRQNGKNFESITQYFNARQKRYKIDDGATVQRSKEQIRHFYYRTWHKIIKYISLPTTLKEAENQSSSLRDIQVNCLIAFNALMNKLHRWNKKSAIKLVELVNHGWTTVREKGKITRLRMPICKVSSKTIAVDSESSNQLPATIQVQLEPRNEAAYCRVHKLAQNPFLSIELQTLQSVKFLIEFLENKWKNRRNQYIDKFQINDDQSGKAKSSVSDSENEAEKAGQATVKRAAQSLCEANSLDNFSERLVLFPNESHQVSNLDLYEAASYSVYDDQAAESDLVAATLTVATTLTATPSTSSAAVQTKPASNSENLVPVDLVDMRIKLKSPLRAEEQDPAPLGVQPLAAATATAASCSSVKQATPAPKATAANKQSEVNAGDEEMADDAGRKKAASENSTKNGRICYQLSSEQLRAGLTTSNASLVTLLQSKEAKDLTFIQLYLALNKPKVISLKYDWVSPAGAANNFNSLTAIQQQQQRFYIDTLASVASSYLSELQRVKAPPAPAPAGENHSTTPSSAQAQPLVKSSSSNNATATTGGGGQASTSPTKTFTSANMPSSLAILQPNTGTTTVVPIDVMLKRIADEQTNKTKKLLSDLNAKRRTRQRKPIMVVNSGNPPRTMLPKMSINGQQLIITPINLDMSSALLNAAAVTGNAGASAGAVTATSGGALMDAQQQQNIVFSGPVAAVARQIVNTTAQTPVAVNSQPPALTGQLSSTVETQQQQQGVYSSTGNSGYQEMISHQIPQSSKLAIPSFHQAYSNLIPQIMNTLAMDGAKADGDLQNSGGKTANEVANLVSPPNLTDMSLLELSINNSDSLFGPSASASNQAVVSTKFGDIGKRDAAKKSDADSGGSSSACVINLNDCSNLSNLSTLNNILNSLTCKSGEEHSDMKLTGDSSKEMSGQPASSGGGGGFSLTHKRSEALLVEWTDSMNDVSLTGCFLNDLQSPEKPSKTSNIVHVLNDNSRDSIFFNMDTIMDIIPPVAGNRYDESSLITSLTSPTLNNIGNSDS